MTISVLLADDHHVVRQGLRVLLESTPEFSVVGETGDGLEVVDLVERLNPDVLVVDVMMPGLNGLEVTRRASKAAPQTGIVVLSMYGNEAYVQEALRNGAVGYVLKNASTADLIHAVREAAAGRRYLGPPLSERAIEAYVQKAKETTLDMYETLTAREREVLHLTAEGLSNTEIAARLFLSPRTVEAHRANLMHKLDLHTQTDVIRYALQRGIISIEDGL